MILELATTLLALAADASGSPENTGLRARIAAVNEARKEVGVPPMTAEEILAMGLEERPPFVSHFIGYGNTTQSGNCAVRIFEVTFREKGIQGEAKYVMKSVFEFTRTCYYTKKDIIKN